MLFGGLFCRIGSQTGPEMWQKVSLWDHPGDAMLQYVVIFSTLVFERPYNVLAIFSNVSWARNVKKPSTKTLETYLAARCEKNTLRNLKNQRKKQKTTPIEAQMGAPAADFCGYFSLGAPMHDQIGAMISRGCQKIPKWCHQCFQGVRKWLQGSKKGAKCLQWGAFL